MMMRRRQKEETETQAPAAEELHIEDFEPHTFENDW